MDLESYLDTFTERDWDAPKDAVDESEPPVRIAMIGLGWWVREQAIPAVEDADYCETTVLVSREKEAASELVESVPTATTGISAAEFHDGVATDDFDAAYVCTPNATHLPYVETAAENGKAVLCEKPMEASEQRAKRMVETAINADIPLMIAYRMHTEPAVRRLRDALRDGLLGEPVHIHGHMSQPLLEVIPDPDQWRLDPDLAGPGATVTDIGLYPLNTARFILESDPIGVEAQMSSTHEHFADVPDEHASFRLEFPEDVIAMCTASQNAVQSSHLTVIGTEGTARLEPAFFPPQPRHLQLTRSGTTIETTFEQIDQMREEFDYFARCIRNHEPLTADGEHGLVDMRVIEAIYDAADRGERIAVKLE